jgi:ribosomal protein S18 acetylase RimI-like enzyme
MTPRLLLLEVSVGGRLFYNPAVPLPILNSPVESDLVRLFHRMMLHYAQDLGDSTDLSIGTAISNAALSSVYDANVILDAALPDGVDPAAAVAEVNAHFAAEGSVCHKWVMNPSAKPGATQPLVDYLRSRDAYRLVADIQYLAHRPAGTVREIAGLTIIPARASFKHARALVEILAREQSHGRQLADAMMRHLDNPRLDALLALRDGRPVAAVSVLSAGDAGLIDDVYVVPDVRRQGVGRTMMSRALELCARSLFKHVLLGVDPANAAAQRLYASLGFQTIGQFEAYCPAGKPIAHAPDASERR